MTQLSDELLIAYVDGQLDRPQSSAVARLLRQDYEIAARVQRLQETQARLVEAFGGILKKSASEPLDPALRLQIRDAQPDSFLARYRIGLAAALLFVLAAAVTFAASRAPSEPAEPKIAERVGDAETASAWQAEVGRLHSFFSRDTLAAAQGQSSRDFIAMQLASFVRRSSPLSLPDLTKFGLSPARTQVMNYNGGRFMQVAYSGKEEQPIGLYVMSGGPAAPMTAAVHGDVRTVAWSVGGVQFVLAGWMPKEQMLALAAAVQGQLQAG